MLVEDHLSIVSYALYVIAYGTSILAFLMTRITHLRILFVLSSFCYALYYYIFPAEPLWLDVISEGGFVAVNLFMLIFVYWKTSLTTLTEHESHLFKTQFNGLSLYEFAKLLKIAKWQVFETGEVLIEHKQTVKRLYCVFSGELEIRLSDSTKLARKSGSIIGELSYLLDNTAEGSVTVVNRAVLVSWDQKELHKLCSSNDVIATEISNLLSQQMANKLTEKIA